MVMEPPADGCQFDVVHLLPRQLPGKVGGPGFFDPLEELVSGRIYESKRRFCREAAGGGPDVGQSDAPRCAGEKILKPSRWRPVVEHLCGNHGVSRRRACRLSIGLFRLSAASCSGQELS